MIRRGGARVSVAVTALLVAALTGCGGAGDKAEESAAKGKASPSASVDCTDQSLGQAEWLKHCADEAGTGGGGGGQQDQTPMPLGKTVETIGAESPADGGPGGGGLEVTPTTIVYQREAMGNTPLNGLFAIITVKDQAPNAADAAESAPIEGGGWQWIAPDGQALDEGENEASSITPNGFTGGGTIKAGTWAWRTLAFDITEAQKGGVLIYTDGAAQTYRWQMPKSEQGPELAALKKGMEGEY